MIYAIVSSISSFIVGIIYIMLGMFVLFSNRKTANILFFVFCIFTGVSAILDSLGLFFIVGHSYSGFIDNLKIIILLIGLITLIPFTLSFPENARLKGRIKVISLIYSPLLYFIFIAFENKFRSSVYFVKDILYKENTVHYYMLWVAVCACIISSLGIECYKYFRTKDWKCQEFFPYLYSGNFPPLQ
jgi:hypothetical protein